MLWDLLPSEAKTNYLDLLKVLASLSGLFKDVVEGPAAKKPFLYYRNHEQLFAEVFDVHDITRDDSSFDVIANVNKADGSPLRVGVGLKTFNVSGFKHSFQKVAEFNAKSAELRAIKHSVDLAHRVSELRNLRIDSDIRVFDTDVNVYHTVLKDDYVMQIAEFAYDPINLETISVIKDTDSSLHFTDTQNIYSFNKSKSVLLQKFVPTQFNVTETVRVDYSVNPFHILYVLKDDLESSSKVTIHKDQLVLPLYGMKNGRPFVPEKSGLNVQLSKPKNKNSNTPRPAYEAYLRIPKQVHRFSPVFFGFNALTETVKNVDNNVSLILPSGERIKAIVTQDGFKSLQSNPQSILGKWILRDIYGLAPYELLTRERQEEIGVDSVVLTQEDDGVFSIELGELGAYEKWMQTENDKI